MEIRALELQIHHWNILFLLPIKIKLTLQNVLYLMEHFLNNGRMQRNKHS